MIRVLKLANFSDCGLGTVVVPQEDTAESIAVIGKFYNLTDNQKNKIKAFVNALVDNGIYNMLHYLSLPYFASSKEEAFCNVVKDSQTFPSTDNLNRCSVESDGLTFISAGRVSVTNNLKGTVDFGEFSMGTFLVYPDSEKTIGAASNGKNISSMDVINTAGASAAPRIYYGPPNTVSFNATSNTNKAISNVTGSQDDANNKSIYIAGVSESNLKNYGTKDNTYKVEDLDISSSYTQGSEFQLSGSASTEYHHFFSGHIRLVFLSDLLSTQQMATMRNLIATLCDYPS